jgi:hypothetical protein
MTIWGTTGFWANIEQPEPVALLLLDHLIDPSAA